jgi:hypothetical protein
MSEVDEEKKIEFTQKQKEAVKQFVLDIPGIKPDPTFEYMKKANIHIFVSYMALSTPVDKEGHRADYWGDTIVNMDMLPTTDHHFGMIKGSIQKMLQERAQFPAEYVTIQFWTRIEPTRVG